MKTHQLAQQLKTEFLSGWKPLEVIFLIIVTVMIIWAGLENPYENLTLLGMIAGVSGIICNVFVSKGKISNYFFGLVFAYSYFYVSLSNNLLGEMNTTLYVYIPAQFIGYFLWKQNMQKEGDAEAVIPKSLSIKGWAIVLALMTIGTLLLVLALNAAGGSSTELDGLTTIIVVIAQTLMLLRYREQWLLWIVSNILSIILWEENPSMYIMYAAYLLNSLYGYYNWTKLQKSVG